MMCKPQVFGLQVGSGIAKICLEQAARGRSDPGSSLTHHYHRFKFISFHRLMINVFTVLQFMMDQMINLLKLQTSVDILEVLVFQALGIPYLSNLNQMVVTILLDFLQQSIMVIHIST